MSSRKKDWRTPSFLTLKIVPKKRKRLKECWLSFLRTKTNWTIQLIKCDRANFSGNWPSKKKGGGTKSISWIKCNLADPLLINTSTTPVQLLRKCPSLYNIGILSWWFELYYALQYTPWWGVRTSEGILQQLLEAIKHILGHWTWPPPKCSRSWWCSDLGQSSRMSSTDRQTRLHST